MTAHVRTTRLDASLLAAAQRGQLLQRAEEFGTPCSSAPLDGVLGETVLERQDVRR